MGDTDVTHPPRNGNNEAGNSAGLVAIRKQITGGGVLGHSGGKRLAQW
jgi:hypothetical protein